MFTFHIGSSSPKDIDIAIFSHGLHIGTTISKCYNVEALKNFSHKQITFKLSNFSQQSLTIL